MRTFLILLVLFLSSCRHGLPPWEQKDMDHKNLEEIRAPALEEPLPPRKRPKALAPQQTPIYEAFKKPISLSLSETLSLKQVLPEIARQQGVDLQLDPSIEEKVVFHATERPFLEVIEQLCEIANLRYRIQGKSIRIERDTPYAHNYNVQFLNLARSTENKVSIATDVFAASGKNLKSNIGDNGSNSSVNMTAENDFWKELAPNLNTIVGEEGQGSTFSIHKQGGLISVKAPERLHRMIRTYLSQLRKAVSTQVLIEAKVIEVSLSDNYRSGIDWAKLRRPGDLRFDAGFGTFADRAQLADPTNMENVVTFGAAGKTFSSILHAIEEFGASRTLSSPRITALNNQTAILKVARNQVYFRLNYNKQYNLNINRESYNVSSDIQTVPIGLVMTVQPSIDEESDEIILSLRPTISRMTRTAQDPAVDIAYNASLIQSNGTLPNSDLLAKPKPSLVPVVEVREIDSVLRLKNGEIGVLGGLMESRSVQDRSQLPGIAAIPLAGELAKARMDADEIVELVILLRATIVDRAPPADEADVRLYNNYTHDPRPMGM